MSWIFPDACPKCSYKLHPMDLVCDRCGWTPPDSGASLTVWDDMKTGSKAYQETNDCTVKALALVTDKSYGEAWDILSDTYRRPRCGMPRACLWHVIERLGYTIGGGRYTPKTIGNLCHTGRFLCYTRRHVLTVIDGVVLDWTKGRKHRIVEIVKVAA